MSGQMEQVREMEVSDVLACATGIVNQVASVLFWNVYIHTFYFSCDQSS